MNGTSFVTKISMTAPKHLFFDMDGTLTESRTLIAFESAKLLFLLDQGYDIAIVSGATQKQILIQIPTALSFSTLAQNGNDVQSNRLLQPVKWRNELNWMQKYKVFCIIDHLLAVAGETKQSDHVEDRGCQIAYSVIGHNAPRWRKSAYDPSGQARHDVIEQDVGWFKELDSYGIKYAIGGTTCIDFYLHSKGENVARYVKEMGWKPEECLYIGDALFEGGNDQTVMGVIPTQHVIDPADCAEFMRELLA